MKRSVYSGLGSILRMILGLSLCLMKAGSREVSKQTGQIAEMDYAVRIGSLPKVKSLLAHRFPINTPLQPNYNALSLAIALQRDTDFLRTLIRAGADVNAHLQSSPDTFETVLMVAASSGTPASLRLLVHSGAKVDAVNNFGQTALMFAAQAGQRENIRVLLQSGANLHLRDTEGETALMYAAGCGLYPPLDLLIQKGAGVNDTDNYGVTPLMYAAGIGHTDAARQLLQQGAKVNAQDSAGRTALMYAVENAPGPRVDAMTSLLLAQGADVHLTEKDGRTTALTAALGRNKSAREDKIPEATFDRLRGTANRAVVVPNASVPNKSLLAQSVRIADARDWDLFGFVDAQRRNREMDGAYAWLNDHTILFMRHVEPSYRTGMGAHTYAYAPPQKTSVRFFAFDIRTGKEYALGELAAYFNQTHGNATWIHVSPDGKWVLWTSFDHALYDLFAATVDGASFVRFASLHTDDAQWLGDSRRIVVLRYNDARLCDVALYDVQSQTQTGLVGAASFESVVLTGTTVTNQAHLLALSVPVPGDGEPAIVDEAILASHPQPNWTPVTLPAGWTVERFLPSPQGTSIAWLLRQPSRDVRRKRLSVWVSNSIGKEMRLLGTVLVNSTPGADLELSRLRWLPDGKRLSFLYKNALWLVSAG